MDNERYEHLDDLFRGLSEKQMHILGHGLLQFAVRTILIQKDEINTRDRLLAEKDEVIRELETRLEIAEFVAEEEKRIDYKTGLLNAQSFREEVEQTIQKQREMRTFGHRKGDIIAGSYLLFMDLDNFKHLNQALNNDVVDEKILLPAVDQLTSAVRGNNDLIGRHGGDEFVVFLTDVDKDTCERVAHRIRNGINSIPIPQNGPYPQLWKRLAVSVGIAEYGIESDYETVFNEAHAAHLQSKNTREKNQIIFADDSLTE